MSGIGDGECPRVLVVGLETRRLQGKEGLLGASAVLTYMVFCYSMILIPLNLMASIKGVKYMVLFVSSS